MNRRKSGWLLLLGISLAFAGCRSMHGGTPAWLRNPQSVYPEERFLVAVGEGDTRRAAENAAAANLSRIFEARIEADEHLLDQSRETDSELVRTTDFTADINIASAQTLYNIQHAEAWQDNRGRFHAVAYLERRTTAAIYRDKIDGLTSRVSFLLSQAETAPDLLKKYALLRAAGRHATEAEYLLRQLKVIHPPSLHDAEPGYSLDRLRKELADTARQVVVRVSVEGDSDNRMAATLQELFTSYGFMIGKNPALDVAARVDISDTGERVQGLIFLRYELMLQIRDSAGDVLVTVRDSGREAHQTEEHARNRTFRTLAGVVQKTVPQRLDACFDAMVNP